VSFRVFPWPVQRLLAVFLAVALLLTATLVWLSWQLVRQDEALVEQRIEERRETAADLATAALRAALLQADERLQDLLTVPAEERSLKATRIGRGLAAPGVLVLCRAFDVEPFPGEPLPFYPTRTAAARVGPRVFARVDSLELAHQDLPSATTVAQELARAADPAIRAGAIMRLARIHRKRGRLHDALAAYETLGTLDPARVEGLPAGLVARHEILALLEALGERQRLEREAAALGRDLQSGRWRLLRAEYGFYLEAAQRYAGSAGRSGTAVPPPVVRALAVEWLWNRSHAVRERAEAPAGRRVEWLAGSPVLLLWRAGPDLLAGVAVVQDTLQSDWLSGASRALSQQGVEVVLTDTAGRPIVGRLPEAPGRYSLRPASATSLPWNLYTLTLDAGARHAYFDARRRVLFAGLLFIAFLALTGTYALWRLVAREMAVSRLQADFVSAVSHEFRTPLTALRQFTEMLLADRVAREQDRRDYYQAMARETGRLSKLVERLLDFGRLEAGALRYRLDTLDLGALIRDAVTDFERGGDARNHRIECIPGTSRADVRGDRETLKCVVWNLLDNAVKYSPEDSTVSVSLGEEDGCAAIRVRDHGVGIPSSEREQIFDRFYRGGGARTAGIRGVGIGLAMAREIVRAHGGDIEVESAVGEGSVFTVRIPLAR
jgi:signal transduction histidine kinase